MNPTNPIDDGPFLDDAGPFIPPEPVESESRRPGWTQGHPVVMGDGSTWFLPRLDGAFLLMHPNLAARFSGHVRSTSANPDDAEVLERIVPAMHGFGRELLMANYWLDWLDLDGVGPLAFFDPDARGEFAVAVSEALADAAEACAAGTWELFEADATAGLGLTLINN